jgi:hypothetical protein
MYAFLFSPIHTTCPAHHIFLDFIILIVLGKKHKLWSSPLVCFLQHPVASSIFGTDLLSILFSNTPQPMPMQCSNTVLRILQMWWQLTILRLL